MKNTLTISHITASVDNKEVLHDISLTIYGGEVHALMGPNGAGKTSLAMVLAGHSDYRLKTENLELKINGRDITCFTPDERAREGLFVSFQKPIEIPGVNVRNILRTAVQDNFNERFKKVQSELRIEEELLSRSFENFSGGEGKKMELLQAKVLTPKFVILDEIDSGLDVDALRIIAKSVSDMAKGEQKCGIILITHAPRILRFIRPDHLHIMIKGQIVQSDGQALLRKIEKEGYQWLMRD